MVIVLKVVLKVVYLWKGYCFEGLVVNIIVSTVSCIEICYVNPSYSSGAGSGIEPMRVAYNLG